MYHFQAEVGGLDFPRHLSPLLPIHALPTDLCPAAGCFLHLVLLTGFHAGLSALHSTWLGPVGEACTLSPAGSALILVQDVAATISVIANTGAMLDIGQERSMK
jgi:hypothetical protein